ncbi:MAG: hypothetical protein LAP38_17075 [Acidobacteriia bacterium]|nr:hypothetical protein [Terriglobia bacterium]
MKSTLLVLLAALVAPASSTTITIMPASGIADAVTARSNWLAANFDPDYTLNVTESFENYLYGPYPALLSSIGTFSVMPGSQPGDPLQSNGDKTNRFAILNSSDSPYIGRFNTTPGGKGWLDSNDITQLQLTTSLSNTYFFMTDVDDVDGLLTLKTADGTTASFQMHLPDGSIYFVGITSDAPLGTISWLNSSTNDGFGLDDFGKIEEPPEVPEPASLPTAAAALIAIIFFTKMKRREVM